MFVRETRWKRQVQLSVSRHGTLSMTMWADVFGSLQHFSMPMAHVAGSLSLLRAGTSKMIVDYMSSWTFSVTTHWA